MALIDLKTDLTSLKFGNDRPGYGSSGLPYVRTAIDVTSTGYQNATMFFDKAVGILPQYPMYRPGSTGPLDYPIRGGQINLQVGQQTFTVANRLDMVRISAFLRDPVRGPQFVEKQIGLQLTNPKMETAQAYTGVGQSQRFFGQEIKLPSVLENTRVYNNGINTLAQVGVMGTGAHGVRHGLYPFASFQKNYYLTVNQQNIDGDIRGVVKNRLWNLANLKLTPVNQNPISLVTSFNNVDVNTVQGLGISLNRNLLFQYLGGPGSAYGIGTTTISRATDTARTTSRNAMVYDELRAQTGKGSTDIQDFSLARNKLRNNVTDQKIAVLKQRRNRLGKKYYENKVAQKRADKITETIELLEQSKQPDNWNKQQTRDYRFFVSGKSNGKDLLNSALPFIFNNKDEPNAGTQEYDDMIKFVFEAVSNDNSDYSIAIPFRAYLTAGITDNNTANLSNFRYVGRGENFYTYQGFERSISFAFRIAAASKDELIPMYNRLNTLMSQVYPDYSTQTNIMRAPLVRVTIGDYINRVPGFLESVNVTIDNNYTWEIGNLPGEEGDAMPQLPHVVDVAVTFRPIMDILPERTKIKFSDNAVSNEELSQDGKSVTFTSEQVTKVYSSSPELIANNADVIKGIIDSKYSTSKLSQDTINVAEDIESDEEKRLKAEYYRN